jgi:hypothetical protein
MEPEPKKCNGTIRVKIDQYYSDDVSHFDLPCTNIIKQNHELCKSCQKIIICSRENRCNNARKCLHCRTYSTNYCKGKRKNKNGDDIPCDNFTKEEHDLCKKCKPQCVECGTTNRYTLIDMTRKIGIIKCQKCIDNCHECLNNLGRYGWSNCSCLSESRR